MWQTTTWRKSAKQPKATHGSSMNDKETKFRKTVDWFVKNMLQILDRISLQYAPNANETNEKWANASHERYEKCTIHEVNARYTKRKHDTLTNKRTIQKTQTNERTIHEWTNHWSVAIYYPMTNDPGSIEVQYSIMLLFEWLLCKLMWLTNLIFYTQLIYINDKLVVK